MIDRSGEVIIGETLHLASQRGVDVWNDVIYDCRLVDCRVRIDYPRGLTLFCSTLVNTTVEVSRTAAECGWRGCFFDSCTSITRYRAVSRKIRPRCRQTDLFKRVPHVEAHSRHLSRLADSVNPREGLLFEGWVPER